MVKSYGARRHHSVGTAGANFMRVPPYWTKGRKRSHYLSGAISMTPEGLQRDQLQALATCEHVQPNHQAGQRGPWGYKLAGGGMPRAFKIRGKRRGYKRALRPTVIARHRQGRRR